MCWGVMAQLALLWSSSQGHDYGRLQDGLSGYRTLPDNVRESSPRLVDALSHEIVTSVRALRC